MCKMSNHKLVISENQTNVDTILIVADTNAL